MSVDTPAHVLRDVLDGLGEVVFRTDAEGNWTFLNSAWTRILGFDVASSLGTNFLEYVHPDERERTIALFMAVVAGGADHCHHHSRYRTADGRYRFMELRAQVVRDDEGRVVANVGTLTDRTEGRRAGEQLAGQMQALELVARGAPVSDLPIGVARYRPDGTLARASPALRRLFGAAMAPGARIEALYALPGAETSAGRALGGDYGLVATARSTGRAQYGDLRFTPQQGTPRAFAVTVLPLATPQPSGLAVLFQDVTERWRSERRQAALALLSQHALAESDLDGLLAETVSTVATTLEVTCCVIFERLGGGEGLLPRAALGWPEGPHSIGVVPDEAASGLRTCLETKNVAALDGVDVDCPPEWMMKRGLAAGVCTGIGGPDEPYGVLAVAHESPLDFGTGELDFLRAAANVLAASIARTRSEELTRHQALHDPLTGLANRALLQDRLVQATRAMRRGTPGLTLLLMDLDSFKEINDTMGHDAGDEVLRVMAERLSQATRGSDTVARLGGDEFAVILPLLDDVGDAVALARKLRDEASAPIRLGDVRLRVTASIGIVVAPEHGDQPGVLLKRADVAMYRAKQLPGGVSSYTSEGDLHHPQRLAAYAAFRDAIEAGELRVHFQPKVQLRSGDLRGMEALVRWQRPDRLVLPAEFIPLAEQTGLIEPLTWYVLDTSLAQVRRWGDQDRRIPVAVNLSARLLWDPDLPHQVRDRLQRAGLPGDALELEVTESAVMANTGEAMRILTQLRQIGVRVSVDDFGTGHSSLAYLRQLPVDHLKIDRSFVRDIAVNPRDASIVRSVIDLGHTLGLELIAEGVEDAETRDLLVELGCDQGQGFFLGRPAPVD